LGIATVPVEQTERRVAGLLHLGHQHAAADRVNGPRAKEETVAGPRLEAVQAIGDGAVLQRLAQLLLIDARLQAGIDPAALLRVEDKPGFRLAALAGPERPHGFVIG